jgi:glycosyltransferase involved in cell wall biosynthesis
VRHVPLPGLTRAWDLGRDAAAVRELVAAVRRLRPDVLHTHNPKTGVMGRLVGRATGVPVVVNTCHGLWAGPTDRLRKRGAVYGAEAVAAAVSDAELYQNGLDQETLRRLVRQRKCRVVGNGTNLDHFVPDEAARRRVRTELGLTDGDVLVGGVGRLVTEKGIGEYVAAARALRGRAVFVWVGPPDLDKPDAFGEVQGDVRFLGERTDMCEVYNALDVFALPSYREGFSRSAMEAAACGTAMVLTDIRGCREIGRDGREVLLVPPRDAGRLTEAVGRLIEDGELRRRLADAARRRALVAFDQRRVAQTSIETYAAVAARKKLGWTFEGDV